MRLWVTSLVLVCIGHALDPICNVTSDSKGWNYQIIGDENPPCAAYQWTNKTNFVLVNDKQKPINGNVVQGWNDTYLNLMVCMENIKRNRHCPKEDREHIVQCVVNCTETSKTHPSIGSIIGIAIAVLLCVVFGVALARWCYTRYRRTTKGAERESEVKTRNPLMSDKGEIHNL